MFVDDSEQVSTRCVLIATGADYRKLDVPGREQFEGLGVYYAATADGNAVLPGRGGRSSSAAAIPPDKPSCFFRKRPRRVFLLLRGGGLRKGMSSYLADRIEGADNVEVLADSGDLPYDGRSMVGGRRHQESPHRRDANRPDPCRVYLYRRDSLHQLAASARSRPMTKDS